MLNSDILMVDDSEIVRPGISFLSNARPSVMAWREVEMEEVWGKGGIREGVRRLVQRRPFCL